MSAGTRHFSGVRLYHRPFDRIEGSNTYWTNISIKVWLLLGYPSNILGYPSKYWNYTSHTKFGQFPHSPPVDNLFTLHLTKNIIEHKRCIILFQNGLYTCLISVFFNNKRAMYKFCFSEFLIFFFKNEWYCLTLI